jgi:hypothetical protein
MHLYRALVSALPRVSLCEHGCGFKPHTKGWPLCSTFSQIEPLTGGSFSFFSNMQKPQARPLLFIANSVSTNSTALNTFKASAFQRFLSIKNPLKRSLNAG